ncbi:MAG: CoA-binding protein [Candidatus Margulisiibacteriota bacterium]
MKPERVAVIGASDKPDRYSYMAIERLRNHGHVALPVHPKLKTVQGLAVYPSLAQVPHPIDTITLYVNAEKSAAMAADLIAANPRRVIFNPGTESPALEATLQNAGIQTMEACTLVLLSTKQF